MHIGHFLSTGRVNHFITKPDSSFYANECVNKILAMANGNPILFKKLMTAELAALDAEIKRENIMDPGHRQLFKILLPMVQGQALSSGLTVFASHAKETAAQRNYLHLGETICPSVLNWWTGVNEGDILLRGL
jgi:hypothetical protein